MQRAVNAEATVGLRSSIMVQDTDSRCLKSHCLCQNTSTKVQTQGSTAKKSKPEESRPKDLKPANEKTPALPCTNESEKTSCQDKKKKYFKKKRDRKKRDRKNFILATEDNIIRGEKKQNNRGDGKCYNC